MELIGDSRKLKLQNEITFLLNPISSKWVINSRALQHDFHGTKSNFSFKKKIMENCRSRVLPTICWFNQRHNERPSLKKKHKKYCPRLNFSSCLRGQNRKSHRKLRLVCIQNPPTLKYQTSGFFPDSSTSIERWDIFRHESSEPGGSSKY